MAIGLTILSTFGLCFYLKLPYYDLHSIMPFLILGIGIDDTLVVIQVGSTCGSVRGDVPRSFVANVSDLSFSTEPGERDFGGRGVHARGEGRPGAQAVRRVHHDHDAHGHLRVLHGRDDREWNFSH